MTLAAAFNIVAAAVSLDMATPQQAPKPSLQPEHWIAAGFVRLAAEGIESVRVEVLARDLGVSKGSFYWHFRDREDLLEKMLARWEADEVAWLASATSSGHSAATRWAGFVERAASLDRIRTEASLRAWARRDSQVAARVVSIEKNRAGYIAIVLREIGFAPRAADEWSQVALLVYLGWLDRVTRDPEFELAGATLGEFLSNLILAASARTANSPR